MSSWVYSVYGYGFSFTDESLDFIFNSDKIEEIENSVELNYPLLCTETIYVNDSPFLGVFSKENLFSTFSAISNTSSLNRVISKEAENQLQEFKLTLNDLNPTETDWILMIGYF